jgi:hypothetical protein
MDGRYWNGMKSLDKAYTPIPFDAVSEYLGVFFGGYGKNLATTLWATHGSSRLTNLVIPFISDSDFS